MDESLLGIAAEFEKSFNEQSTSSGILHATFRAALLINTTTHFPEPPKSREQTQQQAPASLKASSSSSNSYTLLVNPKQRGNPILKAITNVPWEYDDIVPDYQMGKTSCALFLSLRYHNLNPDYIHERLKLLGKMYELRVLLVQVIKIATIY